MRVFYFTSSCHRLLKVAGCLFALLTSSLKKACISNLKRSRKQSRSAFCASNKCACQHTSFAAMSLKGAVHPKMKILSAFTHPQVDPNKPVWEDILKNVSWRFIFFHTMEVTGVYQQVWIPILQNTLFCVNKSRINKFIQVLNNLSVSKC